MDQALAVTQIEKLPKWAQEHIRDLQRERDCAVKALNKYCDSQTLSSFYSDEMESTGESQGPSIKRRYFQGRKISVNYAGVLLDISLHDGNEIILQWSSPKRTLDDIGLIPLSFCRAKIVHKDFMR